MRKLFTVLFVLLFSIAFFCTSFAQNNKISNYGYADLKAPPFAQPRNPGIVDVDNRVVLLKNEQVGNPFLSPNAIVSESFDGATFPPAGWTNFLVSGSNNWTRVTAGTSPTNTPHSGAGETKFDSYDVNSGVKALITPVYDLSGRGANTPTVSVWMYRDAGYAGTLDKVDFYMNTAANLTGATLLGTVNRAMGSAPIVASEGWYQYTYNVPAGFNTQFNYFIIKGTSAYGNNIYVDDVSWVTYPGTSPALTVNPSSLAFGFVPVGGTSAVKADTLRGAYLTGFPSNIVVTAPAGFEVCLTSGGTYTSSVNVPYTSATLAATTIYSRFKPTLLQAYSGNITNAGGGAVTVNVGVTGSSYLYTMYCTSSASTAADEDIFNVTLGTLNNSSTCATTGGIGSVINQYSNYTTTVTAPNIQAGGSIPFSVTSGTCGSNYGNAFKIFIDFNQNGSFLDAGEEVYVSPVSTSGPHTETGNVSVSSGATLGNTMMRVVCVETTLPSSITSCGTYSWGETEDYVVNITAPAANDVGTLSIDISDISYPGSFTPKATVKNFGSATQSFPVTMVINPGGYTSTQSVTALASGLTQQVSFAGFTGAVGSYNVTVYTQLNPDANMTNDTLRKVVNFSNGLWISGTAATVGTYLGTGAGYTRNDSGWVFSMGGNSTLGTEVIKYNVLANTYSTMTSMPAKIIVGSSAVLKDSIYVIGGSTDGTNYLNTVVKYNINTNTWSTLTSTLPVLIGWSKSAGYQDSLIYCAGGIVSGAPVNTLYLYNSNTNTWRSATSLPAARFGGAFAISGDTLIYVGGADVSLLYATTYRGVISQTDRSVITWTTGTNYPGGTRFRFDAAPMGNGTGIMVAGGSPSTAWTAINDAYSYSPGLDKWTRRFNKTTAVLGASVGSVYIGNNNWRYAAISGYTGSAISTVTELYADTILTKPSFAPTLISPASGSTGVAVTPTLDWSDVGNTTNYGVQVSTENTFTTGIVVNTSGLGTSQYVVPASILSNSTLYYWRARANNGAGSSDWSSIWNFTTIIALPNAPTLLSPANSSVGNPLSLNLVWNKPASATGYNVLLATDAGFTNIVLNDSALTDSVKALSNLNPLTTYYWKVRAKNIAGWGAFSSAFNFKTVGSATQVVLSSPANGSTNQPTSLTFKWLKAVDQTASIQNSKLKIKNEGLSNGPSAVTNYWFEYGTDSTFTTVIARDSSLTDTTKSLAGLSNLTKYYWRVKAKNQINWGAFSSIWNFTTVILAPSAPTLVSPVNASTGNPLNLNLVWTKPATSTGYNVVLATDAGFTSIVLNDSTLTDSVKALTNLTPLTTYYWKVRSKNAGGWSVFSGTYNFKTLGVPTTVALSTPANNATGQPTTLTFKWFKAIDQVMMSMNKGIVNESGLNDGPLTVANYWFELSTDSLFATVVTRDSLLTDTTKLVAGLNTGTNYYWRVKAKNQIGWGTFSARFKFTTLVPTLSLNLKVYLQGFWNGTTQVTDTVMVYLANSTTPYAFVDTAKVVLSATGTASMNFNRVTTGSYYIVVSHRNHLETWSKLPQSFVGGTPFNYDFTTAATQAFGDNMKQVGSVWVLFGGDANRDGSIDAGDISIFIVQYGNLGYLSCDFNGDGDVNAADILIIANNFGLIKLVPGVEPLAPETIKGMKTQLDNAIKNKTLKELTGKN